MNNPKFSHKTPHLKGKQHQLDPNLDVKQSVKHATIQYVDWDNDGDVDEYDKKPKLVPDENPNADFATTSKKLIGKQKGEIKHTKRGIAYEDLRKWFGTGGEGGVGGGGWDRYNTKGERIGKCAREPGEPKPKCLSKEKASKMTKGEISAAVKRKRREDPVADRSGKGGKPIMSSNKIDEGLLDKIMGRRKIGTTGSGKGIYVSTKNKKPSNIKYGDKSVEDIKKEKVQKTIDKVRKSRVDSGQYDDPWLKSSSHSEKKYHYRQLRGEEKEEMRYCMKCKKMETRKECSYGPEMWDKMTIKNFNESVKKQRDHEYSMARSELATIEKAVKRLKSKMKGEGNIEAWVQSKITKAADYIDSAADYVDSGEHNVQGSVDEAKGPCWTGYKQVGMKKKGSKMVPNCVPEETTIEEENQPTNPALWSKAKALAKQKFDVYPSAYANGWASKWYKSKGGSWKSVKEETIEDLNGKSFLEVTDLILPEPIKVTEATHIKSKNGNLMMVIVSWRGKTYSLRMFFPQLNLPSRNEIESQIQKVYPGSRLLYSRVTEQEPGQPFLHVTNGDYGKIGPNNNYVKPMGEDWQKVNRQDKTDGLSPAAVKAYRRENPGSKLQTAVTEKKPTGKRAERRKSFCRRMKGMKSKLTSAETARDPDSRINKALRRWNCN